jgi:hypothetical protein
MENNNEITLLKELILEKISNVQKEANSAKSLAEKNQDKIEKMNREQGETVTKIASIATIASAIIIFAIQKLLS